MTYCAPVQADPRLGSVVAMHRPQTHEVNVILPDAMRRSAAHMIEEFFEAANDLIDRSAYRVTVHSLSDAHFSDPRYWQGRLVVFLGDIRDRWSFHRRDRKRAHQILRLAGDKILVGGAVFLLCGAGQDPDTPVAIHPNFLAAAEEEGLRPGEGRHASEGSVQSAISTLAALELLLRHVAHKNGDYFATALGDYMGLSGSVEKTHSRISLDLRRRSGGDSFVAATLDLMEANLETPFQIADLAREQNVSPRQLQRRFMNVVGETPLKVYRALQVERAHQLLVQTSLPVAEIALVTGFGTLANLTRSFRDIYDTTPKALRRKAFHSDAPLHLSQAS